MHIAWQACSHEWGHAKQSTIHTLNMCIYMYMYCTCTCSYSVATTTTQKKGIATQHNLPKKVIFKEKLAASGTHTWAIGLYSTYLGSWVHQKPSPKEKTFFSYSYFIYETPHNYAWMYSVHTRIALYTTVALHIWCSNFLGRWQISRSMQKGVEALSFYQTCTLYTED